MNLLEKENTLVRKYLPIKYLLHGRDVIEGLDCYGLIINVYKDFGFDLLDIEKGYEEKWARQGKNYFIENYYKQWCKVSIPAFLDVVLFKNSKGIADHGGVILRDYKFLHCSKVGVTVGKLFDDQWERRLEGFYHLKARHG